VSTAISNSILFRTESQWRFINRKQYLMLVLESAISLRGWCQEEIQRARVPLQGRGGCLSLNVSQRFQNSLFLCTRTLLYPNENPAKMAVKPASMQMWN